MPKPYSIQLLNGAQYFPRERRHEPPQDYDIEHIAYVLSGTFRFNAITRYSVAQHCVIGSHVVAKAQDYAFLMHDTCEAYTGYGDVPAPLKERWLKEREHWITLDLAEQFGFQYPFTTTVHKVDARMAATERRDLLVPADWLSVDAEPYEWKFNSWNTKGWKKGSVHCIAEIWKPETARLEFLRRYEDLKL